VAVIIVTIPTVLTAPFQRLLPNRYLAAEAFGYRRHGYLLTRVMQHQHSGLESDKNHLPQRRGILGGTFNPPHNGHLQLAQIAQNQANLAQVIWIPTYNPPHRNLETLVPFTHRLAMVQRAIAPFPRFQASAVEQDIARTQTETSFAVYTLSGLQQLYPQSQWYWILGFDAFCTLPRWRYHHQLIPQCTWLVAPRFDPDTPHPAERGEQVQQVEAIADQLHQQGIPLRWQWLSMPSMEVSSSQIRHYRGERRAIAHLVPPTVEDYIQHYNLYPPRS